MEKDSCTKATDRQWRENLRDHEIHGRVSSSSYEDRELPVQKKLELPAYWWEYCIDQDRCLEWWHQLVLQG
jgi:hypothetical protein